MHTATAIMKAATSNYTSHTVVQTSHIQQTITQSREAVGVSPGKAAEICGKSLDQLGTLKQLFERTQKEFEEKEHRWNLKNKKILSS